MFSFRTQIILTDIAIFILMVAIHAAYIAALAFVLGLAFEASVIVGVVAGVWVHRAISRSIDAERERKGTKANDSHKARMAARRNDPFTPDQH